MSRASVFIQPLIECRDKSLVGGKAANLGRLARLGFPVPDGFVVTTGAYRFAHAHSPPEERGGVSGDSSDGPQYATPTDPATHLALSPDRGGIVI